MKDNTSLVIPKSFLTPISWMCSTVNCLNIKTLEGYKESKRFLSSLGVFCDKLFYLGSNSSKEGVIDTYSIEGGDILVYVINSIVIGCRVINANYLNIGYLKNYLKGFSVYETASGVVCTRNILYAG